MVYKLYSHVYSQLQVPATVAFAFRFPPSLVLGEGRFVYPTTCNKEAMIIG